MKTNLSQIKQQQTLSSNNKGIHSNTNPDRPLRFVSIIKSISLSFFC